MLFATGLTFCVMATLSMGTDEISAPLNGTLKKMEAWRYDVKQDSSFLVLEEFYDANGMISKTVDEASCYGAYKYDDQHRLIEEVSSCGESNNTTKHGYFNEVAYDTSYSGWYSEYTATRTLESGVLLEVKNYRNYLGKTSGSLLTISKTYYDGDQILRTEEVRKEYYDPEIHGDCEYDERDTVEERLVHQYVYNGFDSLVAKLYINLTKTDTISTEYTLYDSIRQLKTGMNAYSRGHLSWKKRWSYGSKSKMASETFVDYSLQDTNRRSVSVEFYFTEKDGKQLKNKEKTTENGEFCDFLYKNGKLAQQSIYLKKNGELKSTITYKYIYQ